MPENEVENVSRNCKHYNVVKSIQPGGRCFTFFHGAMEPVKISMNKSEGEPQFDEIDLVVMKLNFTPEDGVGIKQTGGRIIIHDNLDVPSTLVRSVPIRPGGFYEIYIKRGKT